ncbi:GNAT family N-acetyltransferase [Streptomyces meridianus]|uniref:GNAT family N-acetyltransferase n=1 Tax=Streptomyces meridianus TaxID=2938945 RepID=A0ABT0X5U5_9ACTN|nr:GNAT family N-acetyltransferase [Streptomyces meridianus]MCM2577293.1 GNAT family N-acetyltransferase [Streptomyces meridianus]
MSGVRLRECEQSDLERFFAFQLDREANRMAAFTREDPADRAAFDALWRRITADGSVVTRTVTVDGEVAGSIMTFLRDGGGTEVTYWIDPARWGRGIASQALAALLDEVETRPLHARVAKDNVRSLGVLRRNGFTVVGEDSGYAAGRGEVVEEYLMRLG